jgi:uncharacterized protein (TIGR02145 family)
MRTAKSFLGAAGVSLALAFTFFACTSDGVIGGEGGTSSSILPSSSSLGTLPSSSSVDASNGSSSSVEEAPSSSSVDACADIDPATEFCFDDAVYEKCGISEYDPTTQFCSNNSVRNKCGGLEYNSGTEFCFLNVVYEKCGWVSEYNPTTESCCGIYKYANETQFCDERDDGIYRFTKIGDQTWMAENLKFNAEGSLCYENQPPSRCLTYGRLYDWVTAMGIDERYNRENFGTFPCRPNPSQGGGCFDPPSLHQGICPSGWHIPTDAEWTTLIEYVELHGSAPAAGFSLKSSSQEFWNNSPNGPSTDQFGFTALPGGFVDMYGHYYNEVDISGNWWSATESYPSVAWMRYLNPNPNINIEESEKQNFYSIRCVKN